MNSVSPTTGSRSDLRILASILTLVALAAGLVLKKFYLYYLGFPDGGTALDQARRPVAITMVWVSFAAAICFGSLAVGQPVVAGKKSIVTTVAIYAGVMAVLVGVNLALSLVYPGGSGDCYFCR